MREVVPSDDGRWLVSSSTDQVGTISVAFGVAVLIVRSDIADMGSDKRRDKDGTTRS